MTVEVFNVGGVVPHRLDFATGLRSLRSEHQKEQQDWLLKLRKKAYIKVY